MFLMHLGFQVLWESEQECFCSFMREVAYFYSPAPLSVISVAASDEDEQDKQKYEAWRIQNILFHAMRKYLAAPKDNDVVQVASLPDLYRVFKLSSNAVRLHIILQLLSANTGA
ncbi:uncharacterized protein HD556DRAFT_1348759 [Suillus plorans]|uniref:DNA mismatch repair protein Mlh1 C-terminal domain-containing protein n=1 Tax=Suillus plorans TaxID=116603 RepID=A0A9P7DN62_9AGAM|nr:uncharacterized protein HD556DRAFT_1348759 [Suillus plorans]KAG1798898.1 hypothetical protein HD556DRAFT_1348759 [Suillus plorans]